MQAKILELESKIVDLTKKLEESQPKKPAICNLMEAVCKKYPDYEETFNHLFIYQQLECVWASDSRAFRWHPTIRRFTESIVFEGGQRVLNLLRGRANQTKGSHGPLKFGLKDFNLYLPALSSLTSHHMHIDPYPKIDLSKLI